ncbi:hypothetical protein CRX72_22480 [Pantoea sp. BRM17]|nr:hypothetical protein CRX72_22480 [Pantoea sp. BRM17]
MHPCRFELCYRDIIDNYYDGVAATYIGIPLFLIIWMGYRLTRGSRVVKYSEMEFPVFKQ